MSRSDRKLLLDTIQILFLWDRELYCLDGKLIKVGPWAAVYTLVSYLLFVAVKDKASSEQIKKDNR